MLFGSVARGTDTLASDIDLLFVLKESRPDSATNPITALARQASPRIRLAISSDTYERLQYFIAVGDPFVRTIFGEGEILLDTRGVLADLRVRCHDPHNLPDTRAAARYLHSKALFHHRRVHEQLHDVLGDLQLSLMARLQALSILNETAPTPETFLKLSTWAGVKTVLGHDAGAADLRDDAKLLIESYKHDHQMDLFRDFQCRFSAVAEWLERAFINSSVEPADAFVSNTSSDDKPSKSSA